MSQIERNKHNYYKELKRIHAEPLSKQIILQGFAIIGQYPSRPVFDNTCSTARRKRDHKFIRFLTKLYSAFLQSQNPKRQQLPNKRNRSTERYLYESSFAETAGDKILKKEFPSIKYGYDKDFEDYINYRRKNQRKAYLEIYARLEIKYPDPEMRTTLLQLFRKKNSQFNHLFNKAKKHLVERIISRIKIRIDSVITYFTNIDFTNALEVLNTISSALKQLPGNKQKASLVLSRMNEYADILKYYNKEFNHASNLIIDYLTDRLFQKENFSNFDPRRINAERERQVKEAKKQKWLRENSYIRNKKKEQKIVFDISKIKFSARDIQDICIKAGIPTKEGETLAYCHKYWLKTQDINFERKIFLYSKIHKTDHYEIFMRIKNGRRKKKHDNDILFEINTFLSRHRGYYYSVRSDKQMQKAWRIIKPAELPALTEENTAGKPKVASKTPKIVAETPKIVAETPKIVAETPKIVAETPKIVAETPKIVAETPKIVAETPKVVAETPKVATETPKIVAEIPKIVAETPKIVAETPKIVAETPKVVAETPKIVAETPKIVAETPKIVAIHPNLSQSKKNITPMPKKQVKHNVKAVAERRERPVQVKSVFDTVPAEKLPTIKKEFKHKLPKHIKDFLKSFIQEKNITVPDYKITIIAMNMLHFLEKYMDNPGIDWRFSELRQKVLDVDTIFSTIYDLSPIVKNCFNEIAGDGQK